MQRIICNTSLNAVSPEVSGIGPFVDCLLRQKCLQDVSKLVDVCRESIIFSDGHAMAECFRTIATDPEVEVVRVKNRFDRSYDSRTSAGYRDIGINLVIQTGETVLLGVDRHVCELQLQLLPFAELKVRYQVDLVELSCVFVWPAGRPVTLLLIYICLY